MPSSTASSSLHTTSHPASSSSDYLLLTTDSTPLLSSSSSSIPLPPPRFRPLLQLATVLDLSFTLIYGVTQVELSKLPASAISLNLARPILVLWAVSTVRVREMAPVLLGQVIVSALVLLYRLNELVQRSSLDTTLLSSLPPFFAHLFNPISIWYLSNFGFSLVHYALYILFVGIRNRRNPFVGRRRERTRSGIMRRRSTWGEEHWNGREDVVSGAKRSASFTRSLREGEYNVDGIERVRSIDGNGQDHERDEEEEDFEEDEGEFVLSGSSEDESESEDENEIIDIPRPGQVLRNRNSRASLLSLPTTTARGNSLKASRDYGSMRSLSGI